MSREGRTRLAAAVAESRIRAGPPSAIFLLVASQPKPLRFTIGGASYCYYFGASVGQSRQLRRTRQDTCGAASCKSLIFRVPGLINCGALRLQPRLTSKAGRVPALLFLMRQDACANYPHNPADNARRTPGNRCARIGDNFYGAKSVEKLPAAAWRCPVNARRVMKYPQPCLLNGFSRLSTGNPGAC